MSVSVLPSCPSHARLRCGRYETVKLPAVPLILVALLTLQLLSACSAPVRAPVSSREQAGRHAGPRPSHYRVVRGDTLYSIAWRYGLGFRRLAAWNRVNPPYTIYPGQRLRLSVPSVSSRSKTSAGSSRRSVATSRHPVKKATSKGKGSPVAKPKRKAVNGSVAKSKGGKSTGRSGVSWRWPATGRVIQGFARGDPLRKGIQISGRMGQSVVAAGTGKVVYAGSGLIGYGRLIIIKHNSNYLSAYGHNRKLLVREGDNVSKGQQVAEIGKNSSGRSMLHFEIRRNGAPVDPLKMLPRRR